MTSGSKNIASAAFAQELQTLYSLCNYTAGPRILHNKPHCFITVGIERGRFRMTWRWRQSDRLYTIIFYFLVLSQALFGPRSDVECCADVTCMSSSELFWGTRVSQHGVIWSPHRRALIGWNLTSQFKNLDNINNICSLLASLIQNFRTKKNFCKRKTWNNHHLTVSMDFITTQ